MYCGVFSIFLGSICRFPLDSDGLTNNILGVSGRYPFYSSLHRRVEGSVLDL
jgi:hypothetical protein